MTIFYRIVSSVGLLVECRRLHRPCHSFDFYIFIYLLTQHSINFLLGKKVSEKINGLEVINKLQMNSRHESFWFTLKNVGFSWVCRKLRRFIDMERRHTVKRCRRKTWLGFTWYQKALNKIKKKRKNRSKWW